LTSTIVVAATHDTSYQNDAGGIKASSRWLSEATPSGYEMGVKAAGTPAGVQDLMPRCRPVVSSLTLLNHRLLAAMPPASSRSKSVINGRGEYKTELQPSFTAAFSPDLSISI
jgi:hypothetical protein